MLKVVVIGGGLSGLSLAANLVDEGFEVVVLEKNKYLGGRASNVIDKKMKDPVPISPHIFVSGYKNYRDFLKKIGAKENICWERDLFLEVIYKGEHIQFKMSDLPTSLTKLHKMFTFKFTTLWDKLSNIRLVFKIFFTSIEKLEKYDEMNAYEYLEHHGVSKGAIEKM